MTMNENIKSPAGAQASKPEAPITVRLVENFNIKNIKPDQAFIAQSGKAYGAANASVVLCEHPGELTKFTQAFKCALLRFLACDCINHGVLAASIDVKDLPGLQTAPMFNEIDNLRRELENCAHF